MSESERASERERDRETETDRQTERERERERERVCVCCRICCGESLNDCSSVSQFITQPKMTQ